MAIYRITARCWFPSLLLDSCDVVRLSNTKYGADAFQQWAGTGGKGEAGGVGSCDKMYDICPRVVEIWRCARFSHIVLLVGGSHPVGLCTNF